MDKSVFFTSLDRFSFQKVTHSGLIDNESILPKIQILFFFILNANFEIYLFNDILASEVNEHERIENHL